MIHRLAQAIGRIGRSSKERKLFFGRPLLLFQSDDWGRVGIQDRSGWETLCASGIDLGSKPYDFYSLETAGDLEALFAVLRKHRDAVGRSPSVVMNFITANVDFARSLEARKIWLKPLSDGLPGTWERPGLFDAYRNGVQERLIFPAFHGLTHFCSQAVSREIATGGDRAAAIETLWKVQTSYIHWRMPWIGYEYWDPEKSASERFLPAPEQKDAIDRAAGIFRTLFGGDPLSACAPGYRANDDTREAWRATGVRVVQCGPGKQIAPTLDEHGILATFRNIEMELATSPVDLDTLLRQVETCFGRRVPAVVSVHSINFHSTLKDFRSPTLRLLDDFLKSVRTRWPDVLFVNDADLWHLVNNGAYESEHENVCVEVTVGGDSTL